MLAGGRADVVGTAPAAGMAFYTTTMRTWQDFEWVALAQLPMFLLSATFYPLSTYPEGIRWLVPVHAPVPVRRPLRGLSLGEVGWATAGHVAYLAVLGVLGVMGASRRIARLLLT